MKRNFGERKRRMMIELLRGWLLAHKQHQLPMLVITMMISRKMRDRNKRGRREGKRLKEETMKFCGDGKWKDE